MRSQTIPAPLKNKFPEARIEVFGARHWKVIQITNEIGVQLQIVDKTDKAYRVITGCTGFNQYERQHAWVPRNRCNILTDGSRDNNFVIGVPRWWAAQKLNYYGRR